jgi:hypothetical protein
VECSTSKLWCVVVGEATRRPDPAGGLWARNGPAGQEAELGFIDLTRVDGPILAAQSGSSPRRRTPRRCQRSDGAVCAGHRPQSSSRPSLDLYDGRVRLSAASSTSSTELTGQPALALDAFPPPRPAQGVRQRANCLTDLLAHCPWLSLGLTLAQLSSLQPNPVGTSSRHPQPPQPVLRTPTPISEAHVPHRQTLAFREGCRLDEGNLGGRRWRWSKPHASARGPGPALSALMTG